MAGLFISLEGPDGSGKSTAAQTIVANLTELTTKPILLTREPGGSVISEQIRQVILDVDNTQMDARTEALLYAAQRRQHLVDVILPALKEGQIVISDRYVDSSIAYQGAGRQLGTQAIAQINQFATRGFLPQLTLYFDIPVEVGLARIKQHRVEPEDRLEQEKLAFHQRVQQQYQQLLLENPQRMKRIDAQQSPAQVAAEGLTQIKHCLKEEG
ncbi:dTMP kinase [Bombilactobacillus folatiphilus]|uniref:Thymidylate kinase n=1 Tax=Bombilactobacillus folatiphilus TaxID=2923362 RepID=A0ABY4P9K3_9LACO|nr:dTMP kinase [Bombilactobacillus folatiphilus]UQS82423.1 dTMP kinase [Bombilactobacillus folatiphilus]